MGFLHVAAVALGMALSGCAALAPSAPSALTIDTQLVDRDGRPASMVGMPARFVAVLPLIAGSISGTPNTEPVLVTEFDIGSPLALDLGRLQRAAAQHARPLDSKIWPHSFRLQPADTRIARVATLSGPARERMPHGFVTGIQAGDSADHLVLVYFDRACRLGGIDREQRTSVDYRVNVPAAGLHWLRFAKTGPDAVQVSIEADPVGPRWSVRASSGSDA